MEQEISSDTEATVLAHIEFIVDGAIARDEEILRKLGVQLNPSEKQEVAVAAI